MLLALAVILLVLAVIGGLVVHPLLFLIAISPRSSRLCQPQGCALLRARSGGAAAAWVSPPGARRADGRSAVWRFRRNSLRNFQQGLTAVLSRRERPVRRTGLRLAHRRDQPVMAYLCRRSPVQHPYAVVSAAERARRGELSHRAW